MSTQVHKATTSTKTPPAPRPAAARPDVARLCPSGERLPYPAMLYAVPPPLQVIRALL